MQLSRPHHKVDKRRSLENQLLVFLCHAAQDPDHLFGMVRLGMLQASQRTVDLVLGMLPDAARFEQDDIRVPQIWRESISSTPKTADDQFAVQNVHLTAHGLDVDLSGWRARRRAHFESPADR